MEPIYQQTFTVDSRAVNSQGQLNPATLLRYLQTVAGEHFNLLEDPNATIAQKGLFWAVSRHRVLIHRMPRAGDTVTIQTWPMPTTKVAYPRAMAMYAADGTLLAQAVSLWVLMDRESRAMVLPGKSGVEVSGILLGTELEPPKSFLPKDLTEHCNRMVTQDLLDSNGHMNNTRYLDWVISLLPDAFYNEHSVKEFTICYHSEALEGQQIQLNWGLSKAGVLQVDAHRIKTSDREKPQRVFTAQVQSFV